MPPGAPARVGLEETREGNWLLFNLINTEMAVYPDELCVLGDYAYGHGNSDCAMKPKERGTSKSGSGKFLSILIKQKDGSWKFAIDCFSDNAPQILCDGGPARLSVTMQNECCVENGCGQCRMTCAMPSTGLAQDGAGK